MPSSSSTNVLGRREQPAAVGARQLAAHPDLAQRITPLEQEVRLDVLTHWVARHLYVLVALFEALAVHLDDARPPLRVTARKTDEAPDRFKWSIEMCLAALRRHRGEVCHLRPLVIRRASSPVVAPALVGIAGAGEREAYFARAVLNDCGSANGRPRRGALRGILSWWCVPNPVTGGGRRPPVTGGSGTSRHAIHTQGNPELVGEQLVPGGQQTEKPGNAVDSQHV